MFRQFALVLDNIFGRVFYRLLVGLIDASFIIGLAMALFFAFANPLLSRFG